jgi:hypothetical protein
VTPSHDPRVYFKKKNPIPSPERRDLLTGGAAFSYPFLPKNFSKKIPYKKPT